MDFDITVNLQEAIDSPSDAKEIVRRVQNAFDELQEANKDLLKVAESSNKIARDFEQQNKDFIDSIKGLTDTLKQIHIVLNARKELWKNDEKVQELMIHLAGFVTGSAAIKLGVGNGEK